MTFETFCKEVKDHILSYLPQEFVDHNVRIEETLKNNGIILTGLVIQGEKNITPNIYLEPFYNQMEEGKEWSDVMKTIAEVYQEMQNSVLEFDTESFSYENVKDRLFVSVVNAEKNEKLLQSVPHEIKEDLALVYRARLDIDIGLGSGTVLIHNAHLDLWGITQEEFQKQAKASMKELLPVKFESMGQALREIIPFPDMIEEGIFGLSFVDNGMYVLSNNQNFYGASYMFDEEILCMISEKVGGNFAILPSSVNECVIVKEYFEFDFEELRDTVKKGNAMLMSEEDILSDSVYYYDVEAQKVSLVDGTGQSMGMGMEM